MNSVKLIAVFFLLLSLMKATSWPLARISHAGERKRVPTKN